MNIPRIETKRLILRGFQEKDLDPYAEMCSDSDVMRYIGTGITLSRAEAWRNMAMIIGHWYLRGYGLWAVEERQTGEMIGRIGCWNPEGWGFLPRPIQVLEKELMLIHGWEWFNYKVEAQLLEESSDGCTFHAKLSFEKPDESLQTFQAKLVKDDFKSITLQAACNATEKITCAKYSVASLTLTSSRSVTCAA
ncbi:MAG: GNAT family N-acetyltransferase [Cyanobacteria bacterium J06639_18]